MKIKLIQIGKTEESYLSAGIDEYNKRLKHYINIELTTIPAIKSGKTMTILQQKTKEAELILSKLDKADYVIILDERGKEYTSSGFSEMLANKMNRGIKTLVFIIGGPYGFADEIYKKANEKMALSQMTFSHQMVRLFFVEQLYRAMTIIKGEAYNH